jgi:hypothetical protein
MVSEHKLLLRAAEAVAIGGAIAAFWLAAHAYRNPDPDFPVFLAASAGTAVLLLTFLPACMLAGEYVRTVRNPVSWRERTEGLKPNEITAIVRWAPKPYLFAACTGVAIAIVTAIKFGTLTFASSQSVNPDNVPGLGLYFSVFFLLALPVLGSAARMPGNYASGDA